MSRLNPTALKEVFIDGQTRWLPERTTLSAVVPAEATSVTTIDPQTGKTALIPRSAFGSQPIPQNFFTNLSDFDKGAGG